MCENNNNYSEIAEAYRNYRDNFYNNTSFLSSECECNRDCDRAVSYTHLDVYKRQILAPYFLNKRAEHPDPSPLNNPMVDIIKIFFPLNSLSFISIKSLTIFGKLLKYIGYANTISLFSLMTFTIFESSIEKLFPSPWYSLKNFSRQYLVLSLIHI